MVNSMAIIENMIYAYIFIVVVNVLVTFRLLDQMVHFVSNSGLITSSSDFIALFFKYQQGIDRALQFTAGGIPIITPVCRLLAYSLQVYMKRISEITLVCISPTVLFTVKGYVWIYLVPQWLDDVIDQVAIKWRNTLLFLTYGEDFSHPPPLEVDQAAIPPHRSPEEEKGRFHPKFGFQPSSCSASYSQSPTSSPTRKGRRREQKQLQQRQEQLQLQKKEEEELQNKRPLNAESVLEDAGSASVWDPTWGIISREVQAVWQAEEEARLLAQQNRELKPRKPLPPVRS